MKRRYYLTTGSQREEVSASTVLRLVGSKAFDLMISTDSRGGKPYALLSGHELVVEDDLSVPDSEQTRTCLDRRCETALTERTGEYSHNGTGPYCHNHCPGGHFLKDGTKVSPATDADIIVQIDNFQRQCEDGGHTDTGDCWDLFNWIRNVLRERPVQT